MIKFVTYRNHSVELEQISQVIIFSMWRLKFRTHIQLISDSEHALHTKDDDDDLNQHDERGDTNNKFNNTDEDGSCCNSEEQENKGSGGD